ncbi:MAG: PSD1 and planctomycete cytochrome C domain-containing protein [Planctomycetaceae bacterium]
MIHFLISGRSNALGNVIRTLLLRREVRIVLSCCACFVPFVSMWAVRADEPVDFIRDIRPILTEHCFACHGPDDAQRQADLRLDFRKHATEKLPSGAVAIQPGDADGSELVRRIETDDLETMMPPPESKRPLTPEQKNLLRLWIASGAEYVEHWAYRKPSRLAVPLTQQQHWPRNEIDAFVLARLEAEGLRPSPEAERTTLIRRLSLDLTGLPPTLEEIDRFLADEQPDTYEKLVDYYLASPHYGEKMAQDWLDLARFGDSSGYQDDGERPNWPYRDYVIGAFNAGMTFDQFTIENLAGDLLPNATLSQQVASGFNRLHRYNEEGGSDSDEFHVVYVADRTNTVVTTWMGLTFVCAQCHDHKYDPFSQRDFYQLSAYFNSLDGEVVISKSNSPPQIPVPEARHQRQLDRIDGEINAANSRIGEIEPTAAKEFESWLAEAKVDDLNEGDVVERGAIGGIVARSSQPAFYADTRFDSPFTLDVPLTAKGRIAIVRSVNNEVNVGYLSKDHRAKGHHLGFSIAEGPRFFAYVGLPDDTRVASSPLAVEHGTEYAWKFQYDPAGGTDDPADVDTVGEGLLTFELWRGEERVGLAAVDLTAAQRGSGISLDAFGLSYRSFSDEDTPIELFVDDVEYTVTPDGNSRLEKFDREPEWTAFGNRQEKHQFGFDALATTSGHSPSDLTVEQIIALPAGKRSKEHLAKLRASFDRKQFPELHELNAQMAQLRTERGEILKTVPQALVWKEMATARPAYILSRGDYQQPRDVVERDVPSLFPRLPVDAQRDRVTLARWLTNAEHPLTARVLVNRLWKQFFGIGLVRTAEDFGVRGDPPTHPELLDWLAVQMIEDGWDIKRMQRRILLSATYRQSSTVSRDLLERDPGNHLLARAARFRLTAEEIRDGALASAGLLTHHLGGPSVYPYQPDHFYRDKEDSEGEWRWPLDPGPNLYRRGLYTFWRRTTLYPAYQMFDAPSRGECMVARARTNTPLQALVTMNDPTFVEAARVFGERIVKYGGPDTASRLTFAFRSAVARAPHERELAVLHTLYETELQRYRGDPEAAKSAATQGLAPAISDGDPVEIAAWAAVATAIMNLDETITRE